MKRMLITVGLSVLFVALTLLHAAPGIEAAPEQGGAQGLIQEVNATLGLRSSEVAALRLPEGPDQMGREFTIAVPYRGREFVLEMSPHSVRHPDLFEVRAQQADGSWVMHDPGPVRTLRGRVAGVGGSRVAGSLLEDGLHATVILPDGLQFWVQPIGGIVEGAGVLDHAVYDDRDVVVPDGVCGVADKVAADQVGLDEGLGREAGGPLLLGGVFSCANLGCDADVEYFQVHGSNVATTQNDIEAVINVVNLQYESQVSISHVITTILVRTAEPDPYTSTDALTLLGQFQSEWNTNQSGIIRDVAHLFSDKIFNAPFIGMAAVGVVCSPTIGYAVVQSDWSITFGCVTVLSAHELGHNWNAQHCTCPVNTMNPIINCSNIFSTVSINTITAFASGLTCLTACNGTVCGNPGAGDCFVNNGTPGCDDAACCDIVCATDPFCCTNSWDQICANEATTNCGGQCCLPDGSCQNLNATACAAAGGVFSGPGSDCATGPPCPVICGNPGAGDCFISNGSAGCNDADCCNLVCALDPLCCNTVWDGQCAGLAAANCVPPPNYDCANAVVVVTGNTVNGDLTFATNDGDATCGSSTGNPDVWYAFTAPCVGTLIANTCGTHDASGLDTGMNTVLSVHSGCPGNAANQIDCNDAYPSGSDPAACSGLDGGVAGDSAVAVPLTPGQTVWIRVSHFGSAIADGTFILNIDYQLSSPVPVNDDCANALPIFNGQTPFNNVCADFFPSIGGGGPLPCPGLGWNIWYVYTAGFTGNLTVDTCAASTFDTVIAAYGGVCVVGGPPANLLGCNDDFCGLSSSITFPVVSGLDYLIEVGGLTGGVINQGTGIITIGKDFSGCGVFGAGGCFVANGTPACDDAVCCNNVCAVIPFCCTVIWDANCANAAAFFCASTCVGDVAPPGGNQVVNIDDLIALLSAFGPCFQCPEDIAPPGPPPGNGVVNIDDLILLLSAFGPCP